MFRMTFLRLALILAPLTFSQALIGIDNITGSDKLEAIALNSIKIPMAVSYEFIQLDSGATLAQYHAEELMIPASVTKLVTAASVLEHFTPAKTFETKFYYSGRMHRGVISGDLYVVGDGDPMVVSERLWQLAADFRQMGVEQIRGDIVIDNSLFDDEFIDSSRREGERRSANAYDAPVSAFGVNFNTVTVSVRPSDRIGARPVVSLDPYLLSSIKVQNSAKTKRRSSGGDLYVERVQDPRSDQTSIKVAGSIGRNQSLTKHYRSVARPAVVAADYIKAFLAHEGIKVLGKTRENVRPKNTEFLYSFSSYPMQKLVDGLNKFSNNFIADVLTKRLGAEIGSAQAPAMSPGSGSFVNGIAAMTDFLQNKVKIKSDFVIKNGSGLDTQNRLSARHLTKLLAYMEARLDLYPEFVASLPASGWDGTLKKRFRRHANLLGGVRAKTGTLSDPVSVSSLAGYLRHPRHGACAFTIIQNGLNGKAQPGLDDLRQIQDELLAYFIEQM
jgi:D-alanyl-D-alanine carboxypeptidase/D-alanyl-D-alanine-endopeptidase (penicillin-binding protein 4)